MDVDSAGTVAMQDPHFQILAMADATEETRKLIRNLDEATDWGPEPGDRHLEYAGPAKWRVLVWVGSELAGKVGIIEREVLIGSDRISIAGIGGVTTAPPFQGKGLATGALALAIDVIQKEMNVPFALLTCRDHRKTFYEERGWEAVEEPVFCEQPDGRVQLNVPGQWMMARLFEGERPAGPIDILGLPF